jgi:trimethylamine---corrinoid protein Co-methyltransferase
MPENYFAQHPLTILSDDSVRTIHACAISLLERVGIRIASEEALQLLSDYGVRCDWATLRAYPNENCIQRAVGTVKKSYVLHRRYGHADQTLPMDQRHSYSCCGGAAMRIYDGGACRECTRQDFIDMTLLHERLDSVDILIDVVEPKDMVGPWMYPEIAAELFSYSSKPLLLQAAGREDLKRIIAMATLLAGGGEELRKRPIFMTGTNAEPPLYITKEGTEVLIDAARAGVPVSLGDYVTMGSSGPLDVAGSLALRTATVLAGLVLTQAAQPGSVYDFSCHSGACDLRNGDVITMSPSVLQLVAGSIQMGRSYGMVTNSLALTEARAPDAQAASERSLALLVSYMAGATVTMHMTGGMASFELADYAQCAIDDTICRYVADFAAGIELGKLDETMTAVEDVVRMPEHRGTYFLGHPHTAKYARQRLHKPGVFAAGSLTRGLAAGEKAVYQKAEERVQSLLVDRRPLAPPDLHQELLRLANQP